MPSVAIVHGFGEGPRSSQWLRQELVNLGFSIANTPELADIIVAHSAGCLDLPNDLSGKLVLLANPSLAPNKRQLAQAMFSKIWWDFVVCVQQNRLREWAGKSLWNWYYIFTNGTYNWRMTQLTIKTKHRLPDLSYRSDSRTKVVVINSRHDPWAVLLRNTEVIRHANYTFVSHPGTHDQIWLTPQNYAAMVQFCVQLWHGSHR